MSRFNIQPLLLLSVLTASRLSAGQAEYHLFFEKDHLHVQVGQYEMRFMDKPSWTFRDVFFAGKKWQQDTGWLQPVLRERNAAKKLKDPFLGTGHRHEQVDEVKINIYEGGKTPRQLDISNDIDLKGRAQKVSITKKSRFVSELGGLFYYHRSEVTLTPEGQQERYWFKAADGDLDRIELMYAFMHIWPRTATQWVVGDDRGEIIEQGTFKSDMSFTCNKAFRWAMVYEPEEGLGTLYVYPKMSTGKNKFWNRTYDRKLYLTVTPPKKEGQEATYFVSLEAFKATDENWRKKGRALIARYL